MSEQVDTVLEVLAYKGRGMHLYPDCQLLGIMPMKTTADPRTIRCAACILRSISEHHEVPRHQPCGTHAAYSRHKARGEDPCISCIQAETVYQRNSKRRQRARVAA